MPKKIRAVLAGCGGISNAWMQTETVKRRVEMVGFVDPIRQAAETRAAQYGTSGAVVGLNLKQVLRATRPDAVFDCSIPEAHVKVTLAALQHGCHVLGEKPMADSMANARRMVAAAKKARKLYAVTQTRRYSASIRALRRFLDAGKIGPVTTVQANFFIGAHFGGFRDVMKHVLLFDMAIHTFDEARFLTGADARHVWCRSWNPAGSWYRHGASAVAVFEMSNKIVFTYQGSWCSEGCPTSWDAEWRIIGEKGTVCWDGMNGFRAEAVKSKQGFMRAQRQLKVPVRPLRPARTNHGGALHAFVAALDGGSVPETLCTDNIKSLAMVHAAIRSANTGRRVAVTL